jgi:hypothetical protein
MYQGKSYLINLMYQEISYLINLMYQEKKRKRYGGFAECTVA